MTPHVATLNMSKLVTIFIYFVIFSTFCEIEVKCAKVIDMSVLVKYIVQDERFEFTERFHTNIDKHHMYNS